jgi:pyrroloquinoline quinone biosynthesis protein B
MTGGLWSVGDLVRIRVLGSAAGGGFPQWNCGCPNCRGVRAGSIAAVARTQESVAVTADGQGWFLLNASPEIRQQVETFDGLHPRAPRHSPIQAIVLTSGDLDHTLGLLSLRESQPLVVYATERVRRGFTEGNALYRTLERFPDQVTWRPLPLGREVDLAGRGESAGGLAVEAVAVPGKPPVHLEGILPPHDEDNVGIRIRERATGRRLGYFSGVARLTPAVRDAVAGVDCLFFDGTFWSSDELRALGLGTKRAEDMAHLPVGGDHGSLAALAGLGSARRIYIHLNNTNPLLRDDSPERRAAERAGWEVARDGMEVAL